MNSESHTIFCFFIKCEYFNVNIYGTSLVSDIASVITTKKIADLFIQSNTFMPLTVIFPKHSGYASISGSFALN